MAKKQATKKAPAKSGDTGTTDGDAEIVIEDDEELIREKIRAGLTREQAEVVIAAQRAHDEATGADPATNDD